MFLLIKYDCLFPQFGKIVDIIVYSGIIVIYVEIYNAQYFDEHFMSYTIVRSTNSSYINMNDLVIHDPMYCHTCFNKSYHCIFISLPYNISI